MNESQVCVMSPRCVYGIHNISVIFSCVVMLFMLMQLIAATHHVTYLLSSKVHDPGVHDIWFR
jgi:uncharacterized membrane protein